MDSSKSRVSASLALSATCTLLLILGMICTVLRPTPRIETPFDNAILQLLICAVWLLALVVALVMGIASAQLLRNAPLRNNPGLQAAIVVSGGFMLASLSVVNVVALVYEAHIANPEFRAKFNDFFCDLRGTEICADGDNFGKRLGMVASSDNITLKVETATRVWDYCRAKLLDMGHLGGYFPAATYGQSLVDSFSTTDAVDKWCGSQAVGLSVNATSPFSPILTNPGAYHTLQTKWLDCVKIESIFTGLALVCMALVCILDRSGTKKNGQADEEQNGARNSNGILKCTVVQLLTILLLLGTTKLIK
ncbi:hypothetical protein PHYSODRAFT_303051 [Phytophthora sojae]|uniref:Uncharacterized protein n=1 Tax=Phytophthora sojae (strain P6497) TaxID=1094619 RepID=G4ZUN4_PHYSP|nr:hypothetical protein PHYSODRAFT_303051 [Phytophthora sojae]EGZ13508.1 hypothetical protein PHYSODRAFT_303051 [Phytophthora sojae]|eukprot:XP_009530937.1 hypothetical protein PHYSODRAFT_303051 [Phytophthora sojae]